MLLSPSPMVDPVNGFVLFTNAKCGGTTLKHWFLSSHSFHRMIRSPVSVARYFGLRALSKEFAKVGLFSHRYLKDPTDTHARRLISNYRGLVTSLDAPPATPQMPVFMVVRDPYSRAVSAWIDKFCGADRHKSWVRQVLGAFGVESPTFMDFLRYVEATPHGEMNAHWRRQSLIIDAVPEVCFLRLESLQHDMEQHTDVWGDRDGSILSVRTQNNAYREVPGDPDASRMTAESLVRFREAHGAFPAKNSFLTPESRALIRSAWRKDFERFGYPVSD